MFYDLDLVHPNSFGYANRPRAFNSEQGVSIGYDSQLEMEKVDPSSLGDEKHLRVFSSAKDVGRFNRKPS